ncbi:hypothetical protein [Polaromonas sp. C04]|uniref:hypothetical protein n=1 Tax=Polaromonas sp. C04 TaxID=1945857 RepID=UPI000986FD06|nr:hypothetical protein [Polaromonas sp. C04]OOG58057.1 hypothetical protein B0E49_04300 [Polaromonas sp. C04]
MANSMQEQDELQVLQTIRRLTREELNALVVEGESSGAAQALRDMFSFAQREVDSVGQEHHLPRGD